MIVISDDEVEELLTPLPPPSVRLKRPHPLKSAYDDYDKEEGEKDNNHNSSPTPLAKKKPCLSTSYAIDDDDDEHRTSSTIAPLPSYASEDCERIPVRKVDLQAETALWVPIHGHCIEHDLQLQFVAPSKDSLFVSVIDAMQDAGYSWNTPNSFSGMPFDVEITVPKENHLDRLRFLTVKTLYDNREQLIKRKSTSPSKNDLPPGEKLGNVMAVGVLGHGSIDDYLYDLKDKMSHACILDALAIAHSLNIKIGVFLKSRLWSLEPGFAYGAPPRVHGLDIILAHVSSQFRWLKRSAASHNS